MPKLRPRKRAPSIVYVGVDPGISGGLAWLTELPATRIVEATLMPATERDICDWFAALSSKHTAIVAMIESVHAMPQNAVRAAFRFGWGYGGLRMALIAARIPFQEVRPQDWQKAMGIPPRKKRKKEFVESKTQFKNRLKSKAQQLFPSVDVTLKTADALLITEYCYRKHNGQL